jgi:ketosteroid isomerase-like protein
MDASDFDQVLESYHQALGELINRNPELYQQLYSRRDDVTLANPFAPLGPVSRGWAQVADTIERAAANYAGGELIGFDTVAKYVTDQLAYIVELERFSATVGGRAVAAAITLRVTTIFRREEGTWRVVHRQADAITSARRPEAVLGE